MRTREDVMKDLIAEVLDDTGTLDSATRRAAAAGATDALSGLAAKIHGGAYRVTDEDIANARKTGLSEDQVFEAVVSSSLGAAKKRFDAAMSALAAAVPQKKSAGGTR